MSLFSFSALDVIGDLGESIIDGMTAPFYRGSIEQVFAGFALEEKGPSHNEFLLGPGEHQGLALTKPLGSLWGSPGAIVTGAAQIKASSRIEGILFKQTPTSENSINLVVVSSPAKVVFSGCIFQRRSNGVSSLAPGATSCFVLVESGAKAVFSGCVFQSSLPTGAMDTASGVAIQDLNALAGEVFVGTGANYTTQPHSGTVTSLGGEIS